MNSAGMGMVGLLLLLGLVPWLGLSIAVGVGASRLGRSAVLWCLVALIFSPMVGAALVVAGGRPSAWTRLPCPACAEAILPEARQCPYCQSKLDEQWPMIARLGR
jgi:hypothetical protein